ncbi:NEDD4-binding protein 2-like 2 isoform X2 [Echinops telfairi]|uniref:NEDD4-binding protein 2-like 2 isoform X2 n=1 Tax=Echinops telfairi TaxID=9371 RepID=A0AC55DE35_ECHTE|nr:NEDD4-binding protein 2-like 2 isoform X2 [Echinops telfairi]
MPYGDTEAPAMGVGGKGLSGPCCKKLKSAEGPCAPCRCSGRADLPGVQETAPGAAPGVPASNHPQRERSSPLGGAGPEPDVLPHAPVAGVGPQMPADDGIYSTSKAFIGPLYKPPEKEKKAGDRKKDTGRRGRVPGGRGEKPLSATPKPEFDSELCQFYREIEELEQETDDVGAGCQAPAAPVQEQLTAGQDLRRGFLRAAEEEEQGQLKALSATSQQPVGLEPGSYPDHDHGQAASRPLCDGPMTSFPPIGRPVPPFLVPHGSLPPPLPTFNCHLNFRRFHPLPYPPLPHPALHMFPAHEGSPLRGNGCSTGPPGWGCPAPERPNEHPDCLGGHRGTPPCGGVPGLPEGLGRNSLGGATEGHWMDLPLDRWPDGDLPVDRWPGGDLPLDRWPDGDLPVDRWPGGDLPVDRWLGGDLPVDGWPGRDLPVDGWPGRDLPMDRWPGGDLPVDRWPRVDVPVDSWLPGVDLPMDRCPRADVIGDRWPRGDMPVDRWLPGVDLPMDRCARADVTEDRWPRGDLPVDSWSGVDMHLPPPQQAQEEKLEKWQKLLILLRGLPGSGKTTLSRSLLGESPEGIVFSTDDYFRCQDGYSYNANQLGDAHDWNQSRAKEAISQGRSPIIIDNTNTQAWEMRPYVEMAIGQGYRVEFHEPKTWWKFDPEELEKRNKHGVSRKKIAQMLERYEFDVSPALVMNAVEPSHKSALRPPPPEWRPSVLSE